MNFPDEQSGCARDVGFQDPPPRRRGGCALNGERIELRGEPQYHFRCYGPLRCHLPNIDHA